MSYGTVALVAAAAAVWLAIGLTLSVAMGRRGHDAFSWLILGTLVGPLGAIFAVGVDGAAENRAALVAATELLGARLGRLTLATVIAYDCGFDHERTARAALEQQGEALGSGPRLELLHGRPGPVLLERAAEDGYDLLVIGTRGAGASTALLGSTAVDVAQSAKVPVLLMGDGEPAVAES